MSEILEKFLADPRGTLQRATRAELIELMGAEPEEIARDFDTSRLSAKRYNAEYKTLREKYAGKWIAIHGCDSIIVADTFDELLELTEAAGVRGRTFRQHMPPADSPPA